MKKIGAQAIGLGLAALAIAVAGCGPVERVGPNTVPLGTPAQSINHPEGTWQLHGQGTATSPYYWVWVPRGATVVTAPTVPATPQITQTGRWQLYGDGTTAAPYYWVWVPAGTTPPPPPPLPRTSG